MDKMITITAADGHSLDAYFVKAQGIQRGAIVLIQEIFGLTEQLQSVAQQYAIAGFDVMVPALFDRVAPATVVPFSEPKKGLALAEQCSTDGVLLDIQAAKEALAAPRVSVVGFCWGGGLALLAAGRLSLYKGVAYYGTRLSRYLNAPLNCPFQFHFAELDTHSPASLIEQIQTQLPLAECHLYAGVDHAFTNQYKPAFDEAATKLAMQRTVAFLSD
ncbi:dienelactone hydrolase family protein [Alteromonas australica]|uniref:dienelactone hydrolase family protein n=1 Tax=Alteromonas australica TaxID=589873 RepID=UPI0035C86EDA